MERREEFGQWGGFETKSVDISTIHGMMINVSLIICKIFLGPCDRIKWDITCKLITKS